ncbi:Pol polyprotein [Plecturocebus cupreus]
MPFLGNARADMVAKALTSSRPAPALILFLTTATSQMYLPSEKQDLILRGGTRLDKAFPTSRETADTVASILTQEIIPHFGLPATIQSDNSPAFIVQVVQLVAKSLNIPWKLHIPYHPQSSGSTQTTLSLLFRGLKTRARQHPCSQVKLFSSGSSNQDLCSPGGRDPTSLC